MKKFKGFEPGTIILIIITLFAFLILNIIFYVAIQGIPGIKILPSIIAFLVMQINFVVFLFIGRNFFIPPSYILLSFLSSILLAVITYSLLI
ncbi:hypothetical protein Q2T46_02815 [Thermoanaerobacterium sp. CMT5567-10]|uniref:hypothetical protein n=1 Tax=Thermoanaerobacterium sp. CMT5567-10 TaxID=3061989 RepID=UPI0026E09D3D|nr:hypothetical protein [Thermoanaerobacterium sp. CMT5567-10]WKV09407.1 hypothetical protein Q2T46_02815 [Thermoanaerobacterium sp. CMT5567-10]